MNTSPRIFLFLCFVSAANLFLMSCSPSGDSEGGANENRFLSIGTAPPGGAFFVVGGAIAEVLGDQAGDADWVMTAEATMGTQENIRRLASGDLDLAMANAAISYFASRGGRDWETAQPIQSVMTLAPNVAFFITPADSGVKTISDLKGKRVVIGPPGAGFEHFVEPILEAHGVKLSDLDALYGTQPAAVDMLSDGSAAAAFLGGAIPTASITQASASGDIFFIPFEEEARQKLIEEYSFFQPALVEAGTYRGQEEDFPCLNVGSMHLITSTDKDEELIYQLTKALYENREAVVAKHPAGKAINPKNAARPVGTEFHPGAIRFYEEIGIWSE
ncbi:MAG: TAXI family TRAP transporter solute-binding subunit [Verrucomicrobiota bacterium]